MKQNNIFKHIFIMFAMIIAFIFAYVGHFNPYNPSFVGSDSAINLKYSKIFANSGGFSYQEFTYITDAEKIFRPSLGTAVFNNKVVSEKFLGFIIFSGFVIKLFGEKYIYLINPVLMSILIMVSWLSIKKVYGIRIAAISTILILVIPPLIYYSRYDFLESVFGSVFFVSAYFLLLSYFISYSSQKTSIYHCILTAMLIDISIFIRPDYLIFWFIIVVYLSIKLIQKKIYISSKNLLATIMFGLVFIIPMLVTNKLSYGGYFTTGQTLTNDFGLERKVTPGFVDQGSKTLMTNFMTTLNSFPIFVVVFFIVLNTKNIKKYIDVSEINKMSVVYSYLFFGGYILSGPIFKNIAVPVDNSAVRYIIPLYIIATPIISKYIISHKNNLLLPFLIIISSGVLLFIPASIKVYELRNNYEKISSEIIKNTEPNSVVFCGQISKIIFNVRKVGTFSRFSENEVELIMTNTAKSLIANDIPVYLYLDFNFDKNKFDNSLVLNDLTMKSTSIEKLYLISKLSVDN